MKLEDSRAGCAVIAALLNGETPIGLEDGLIALSAALRREYEILAKRKTTMTATQRRYQNECNPD